MKNGKVQIGIIGCGGIANQKTFTFFKNPERSRGFSCFHDIIEERAKKLLKNTA